MQLLWQSALKLLQAREDSGTLAESRLNYQLNRSGLSVVDRERVAAWVLDVMRWQTALDAVIAWRTDGRDQLRPVQLLLRLGFPRSIGGVFAVAGRTRRAACDRLRFFL
jgi:hypothetical protein